MSVEILERPQTIKVDSIPRTAPRMVQSTSVVEPNFGPEDMHAIKAIAYIMNAIFAAALVMYGTITLFAWLGS
jgi:hypothetical protein